MPSSISTLPVQISFTPQWHPIYYMRYNETQRTSFDDPRSFSPIINFSSTQPMPFTMQYQNIPNRNLNALNKHHW